MADILDFIPLFQEDADSVRARIDADANAGVDPTDAAFIDTTPGGWFFDNTQGIVLEAERLWDAVATDYPAAAFPSFAWGTYLDEHALTLGLARKDAAAATGEVTFTGADGTLVATGTQVSTVQTDADADPIAFETTGSGTIAGGTLTLPIQAVLPGSSGNVGAGAITALLSPVSGQPAVSNVAPTTGGADTETDEALRARVLLEYQGAHGAGTIADYERLGLAWPGIGFVKVVPLWAGPGTVKVVVTDAENRPSSGVTLLGLQNLIDPPSFEGALSGSHTLPQATITLDTTAGARPSGQIEIGGQIIAYTGLTATTFTGCTGGSGVWPDDTPVYQRAGGAGEAPIGAFVTVATPTGLTVDVVAGVVLDAGYTLDGTGGTIAVRADVEASIREYVDGLRPGDDVVYLNVAARLFLVPGVEDVTALSLNGTGANVAVTDDQVAQSGTVTLS